MRAMDQQTGDRVFVTRLAPGDPAPPRPHYRGLDSGRRLVIEHGQDSPRTGTGSVSEYRVGHASTSPDVERSIDAPYLLAVQVTPPAEMVAPFRQWLHEEHLDRQVSTQGLRWGTGLEPVEGRTHFLNLWGIDDPSVPGSEEYIAVRATPWYERVAPIFAASEMDREIYELVPGDDR